MATKASGFFVYGTLRDDYPYGYTSGIWKSDAVGSYAIVHGFKMIVPDGYGYPISYETGNDNDIIFGRYLYFDPDKMEAKRIRADGIEGYPTSYQRKTVKIHVFIDVDRDDRDCIIICRTRSLVKYGYLYYQSFEKWEKHIGNKKCLHI